MTATTCPHCRAMKPERLAFCRACLLEVPWELMRALWDAISKRQQHAESAALTAIRSHLAQHSSAI